MTITKKKIDAAASTPQADARMKWCSRVLVASPLHFGLCASEPAFRRELKRLGLAEVPEWLTPDASGMTHYFEEEKGGELIIVCVEPSSDREQVVSTITHEAVHVWQAIREYIGEYHPSPEFEAYSIQTICKSLIAAYDAQVRTARK